MPIDLQTIKELSPIVAVVIVFVLGYIYSSKNHRGEIKDISESHKQEIIKISEMYDRQIVNISNMHKEKSMGHERQIKEMIDMFTGQISAKDERLYTFLGDLALKIERNTNSIEKLVNSFEKYLIQK